MTRESYIPVKVKQPKFCKTCDKPYSPLRQGMCQPCYKRAGRNTDGTADYRREDVDDISLLFVIKHCTRAGTCLVWTGTTSKEGRPQTSDRKAWREEGKNRQILLHRWMYEQSTGETLRKGQHVKQTCENKLCIAPGHLATATPRPGRLPLGEAGQYQGRQRRDDHFERCANGHEWDDDNLYIDPKGRWICRRCSTASQLGLKGAEYDDWQRRRPWEETPECATGHEYAEVGWYYNGEARVCIRCFAEKERKRWLKALYNMTLDDFESLVVVQNFACKVCRRRFDPEAPELTPCVDHNHESGKVRGLLCRRCNLALGHFEDNPERLMAAIDYLGNVTTSAPPVVAVCS